MATGTITREKLTTLTTTLGDMFRTELNALKVRGDAKGRGGLSRRQIDDMVAGHADGMRNILVALRTQGILHVEEPSSSGVAPVIERAARDGTTLGEAARALDTETSLGESLGEAAAALGTTSAG